MSYRIIHSDTLEYKNLFFGKEKEALEKALDIRKFEIELYWKRTAYFWAFIVANYTAYFFVLTHKLENQALYLTLLSFIGLLLAHAWQLTNKGSKFWQKNWDAHVSQLEKNVIGPLYDVFLNPRTPYTILSPFEKYACSPARINTIVCTIFCITGLGLFLYNATQFMDNYNFWLILGISFFFVIISLSLMTYFSFGHRHDDETLEMVHSKQNVNVIRSDGAQFKNSICHFIDNFFIKITTIGKQVWMQDNVSIPISNGCIVAIDYSKIDDLPLSEYGRVYKCVDVYNGGHIINYGKWRDSYFEKPKDAIAITPDDDEQVTNLYYSWDAAMNINISGWHLPSLEEWMDLFKYILELNTFDYEAGFLIAQKLKFSGYGNDGAWTKEKEEKLSEIKERYRKENFIHSLLVTDERIGYDAISGFSANAAGRLYLKDRFDAKGNYDPNYKDIEEDEIDDIDLWKKGSLACFWTSTKRENGDVACIRIEDYVSIDYIPARQLPYVRCSVRLIRN